MKERPSFLDRNQENLFLACILIGSILFFSIALPWTPKARVFPLSGSILLVVLTLALIIQNVRSKFQHSPSFEAVDLLKMVVWLVVFVLFGYAFGFALGLSLSVFVYMVYCRENILLSTSITVFSLAYLVLLRVYLNVPWPSGIWGHLLPWS